MKRRWQFLLVGLLIAVFGGRASQVHAAGAGFTVTPELPKNQIGGNSGYFNLLVKPEAKQALTIRVENQTDKAKNLKIELTDAFTQNNGQVGYAPGTHPQDGADLRLSQIGSPEIELKLAAHQGKPVTFYLQLPKTQFQGQILGSLYVQDTDDYGSEAATGLEIRNRFAMVVAVQLQQSTKLVAPKLELQSVKLGSQNQQPAVLAHLQNLAPRLFGQMTVTAEVTGQDGKAAVKHTAKQQAMAPNSSYDFTLPLEKALAPGSYWLDLTAVSGSYRWHFRKQFTVTAAAASKVNTVAQIEPERNFNWWWVLLGGLTLVALILFVLLWRRRKDNEKGKTKA